MNNNLIFRKSYVDGNWATDGKRTFEVTNPANGKAIASVYDSGIEITKKAIKSANKAFNNWSKYTAKERSKILEKWNDLILEHTESLAEIMTLESGKPINESIAEVAYVLPLLNGLLKKVKEHMGMLFHPIQKIEEF